VATFDERAVVISDATTGDKVAVTPAGAVTTDGSAVTQPVSAAALPLPAGAATEATLATLGTEATLATLATEATLLDVNTNLLSIDNNTANIDSNVTSIDNKLNTLGQKLMAASMPVVLASNQSDIDVNVVNATINNDSVGSFGGSPPVAGTQLGAEDNDGNFAAVVFGQVSMTDSLPVTIASDQSAIAVKGNAANGAAASGNPVLMAGWNGTNAYTFRTATDGTVRIDPTGTTTQPVSVSSLPLPTGAATEATLATRAAAAQLPAALVGGRLDENVGAWLGSTAPTVGQKAMAASLPVTLASDQSTLPISAASLPLPAGAATAANQTTLGSQTTEINDGTNTAAVKAASTAAVAADPALVVAVSPNNIIAVKGNAANGAAVSGNPNLVAGSDGTNARTLATTTTGVLKVVEVGSRVLVGAYGCGTGVIAGTVAAQNLVSIENPVASGKTVYVKRFHITAVGVAAASTSYRYTLGRTTAVPTAGTVLTAQQRATADAAPVAIVRSVPTATAATGSYWSGAGVLSAVNATMPLAELEALRELRESDDIVLAAGEGLLLIAEANDTDLRHTAAICWEEA